MFGRLTLADFLVSEMSSYVEHIFPEIVKEFSFLTEVRNRVESLPEIKKYYSQVNAIKAPFTSPMTATLKF